MLTLDLAGWRVGLECRPPTLAAAAAERFAAFLAADAAAPHLTATVTLLGPAGQDDGEGISAAIGATTDKDRTRMDAEKRGEENSARVRARQRPVFRTNAAVEPTADLLNAALRFAAGDCRLDTTTFSGIIRRDTAEVTYRSSAPLVELEYFLRMVYALLAHRMGGFLLHAAGLLDPTDGRVRLFIGPSGSGKSTVTALVPEAVALNDDLVLVRPEAAGWSAWGTPFWNGETLRREGQTAGGPLAGIYRLVQDLEVYLEPLSPAAAAAELAANCPVVNADAGRLGELLARCRRLAGDVPVQRLHFRKDPSFWARVLDPTYFRP